MMILLINFILKMTLFFSICCFTICFAPSLMLFRRIIVSDPLRIILFVLGAFFWLLSLLFTSLIWAISSDYLLVPVFASVLFQELARGLYYYLLYKAQGGLAKLATDGVDVSGVRLMFSSRHVLAIVCGLGMGVMAALILLTNILADYSDDGVVGLPAAMKDNSSEFELHISDAYFPIYYSLASALLTMFNVIWTITLWDGLHRFFHKLGGLWHICILLTLLSHFMNTTMSIWQRYEPIPVLILQAVLLVGHTFYAAMLVKNMQFHQLFQKERTAGEQQPQPTQRNMNE